MRVPAMRLHMVHHPVPVDVRMQTVHGQQQLAHGASGEQVHHLNTLLKVCHDDVGLGVGLGSSFTLAPRRARRACRALQRPRHRARARGLVDGVRGFVGAVLLRFSVFCKVREREVGVLVLGPAVRQALQHSLAVVPALYLPKVPAVEAAGVEPVVVLRDERLCQRVGIAMEVLALMLPARLPLGALKRVKVEVPGLVDFVTVVPEAFSLLHALLPLRA
mmetsp:Transcript_14443/g.27747  ORF Transcript_14443/g.27747 Transcript_14443/m.27747 type:complete len:219 (+) Transcript_14443:972-1628(+)